MDYILAVIILAILITMYVLGCYLNSKVNKPEGCKTLECEQCGLKCHRRRE